MNFIDTLRKALASEITVKTWWGCNGLTGEAFHEWFRQRLDAKMNREDRRQWRRLSTDYQASLMRDADRVRKSRSSGSSIASSRRTSSMPASATY